jgi:hypothetical protein
MAEHEPSYYLERLNKYKNIVLKQEILNVCKGRYIYGIEDFKEENLKDGVISIEFSATVAVLEDGKMIEEISNIQDVIDVEYIDFPKLKISFDFEELIETTFYEKTFNVMDSYEAINKYML